MGKMIYSMQVSLDGFVEAPDGAIDWALVDEELHRHFNDLESTIYIHLYGRRLYEIMTGYWPTADQNPSAPDYEVEYAHIWKDMPKIVFSKTLDKVEWNSRLVREVIPEEISRLKAQAGKDLSVGGPDLAASFMQLDLIDEYWLYVNPVVLGGGKPMFPAGNDKVRLRLLQTQTFGSGVVLLRYERVNEPESDLPTGLAKPA